VVCKGNANPAAAGFFNCGREFGATTARPGRKADEFRPIFQGRPRQGRELPQRPQQTAEVPMCRRRVLFTLACSAGLALADEWMVRRPVGSNFTPTRNAIVITSRVAAR
jgi:hypothetical protein